MAQTCQQHWTCHEYLRNCRCRRMASLRLKFTWTR